MSQKQIDWKLDTPREAYVPECGYVIGLASRNLAQDRKLRPRGAVMREAVALAKQRGDKLVRLEYVLVALGEHEIADGASPLRGQMARSRKKDREAQAAQLREAKLARRRERAALRRAAAQ